jgi:hypothetical protein
MPIRLWDVEAPTFFRQSAHRRLWSCQPYSPAGRPLPPTPSKFSVRSRINPRATARLDESGKFNKKCNNVNGNRTSDLPACRIVLQPTMLLRALEAENKLNELRGTPLEILCTHNMPYTIISVVTFGANYLSSLSKSNVCRTLPTLLHVSQFFTLDFSFICFSLSIFTCFLTINNYLSIKVKKKLSPLQAL